MRGDTPSKKNYLGEIKSPLSWDEYFMFQAMMASLRSKDPNTKVGAVLVDQDNRQISMGYNGFVAGVDESQLPWGKEHTSHPQHQKYSYVVHAEANAILHAYRPLEKARCYVTLFPCNECAKLIATKKVGEVIYLSDKNAEREETQTAKIIFESAQIKCRPLLLSKETVHKVFRDLEKFSDYLSK